MELCTKEKEINRLQDAFNRHLEIYASNGKEIARLATCIKTHIESTKEYRKQREERDKEIDKWLEPIKTITNGKKMILYLTGFISALGGLWLLIKQIFK